MRRFSAIGLLASVALVYACAAPQPGPLFDTGIDASTLSDARPVDSGRPDALPDAHAVDAAIDDAGSDATIVMPDANAGDTGCTSNAACDDHDACTTDTCASGACAHAPVAIDDGHVCTTDACDPIGGITHTPITACCETNAQCASGVCIGNQCRAVSCSDHMQNGTETDVDCGGPCSACAISLMCNVNADCQSGTCAAGHCVQCVMASTCPGSDSECQTRTCNANLCGLTFASPGHVTTAQLTGDCHQNQCNGGGAIVSVVDDSDARIDGNACTSDVCTAGVPSNPPRSVGVACAQSGGTVCDGAGACVQCVVPSTCAGTDSSCGMRTCIGHACGFSNAARGAACAISSGPGLCDGAGACAQCLSATDCPGSDNECRMRTCTSGGCGATLTASGTSTSSQVAGDCHRNQCDGSGNIVSIVVDTDVPVDGNPCTSDVCTAGVPSNPNVALGTACNPSGGSVCNGAGVCATRPVVVSTTPADATSAVATTTIAVTFSVAMNPATLTAQTAAGPCSGSMQVSLDGFATCIAIASASASMSVGNTVATISAAPGLLVNRTYQIRVTTAATSGAALALASQFTTPTGFTTGSPDLCAGSVVIDQVYGAGGNAGALYVNDYVVLHNRSASPVNLAGWTIQYAGTIGSSWTGSNAPLSGTIAAGGYYLVQEASGGAIGAALPAADATGTLAMAAGAGKVALVSNATTLSGSCPTGVVDLVGYGAGTNCFEGSGPTATLGTATAATRVQSACVDRNDNAIDLLAIAPAPRNGASPLALCGCLVMNESNAVLEADYCDVQFPLSLSVMTGTSSGAVYARVYEAGTTEPAGPAANVIAQLGHGSALTNPEYDAGWSWAPASYNVQVGNDDEYQASFVAPAAGTYHYAYRFSLDRGVTWTFCDANQADFGAGSNAGLTFDLENIPTLTVTP